MPYATGRTYYDADSHLMELHGWLEEYADPAVRGRLRPLALGKAGVAPEKAIAEAERRLGDQEAAAALEGSLMEAKGWSALGAFDPKERSRALDLLGFDLQLVFSTFAPTQFRSKDLDVVYGGALAHNRAIADFCRDDRRLLPVAYLPLIDPARSATAVNDALELGCSAVLVPSAATSELSPTHPDFDPVWARLAEAGVPFMLHIGGGGELVPKAFHANGRPVKDLHGGGENIRSKDYMAISHPPETFLAAMILDGVLERFPGLRGGCIEQGALWVVPWLKRLDLAQRTFRRTEPALALPLSASEYAHRQLWFTPFPGEPVGWMIEQGGDDLFLFSSDYPHPEGGRDPIKHFAAALTDCDETAREKFYAGNFAEMMGVAA